MRRLTRHIYNELLAFGSPAGAIGPRPAHAALAEPCRPLRAPSAHSLSMSPSCLRAVPRTRRAASVPVSTARRRPPSVEARRRLRPPARPRR